MRQLALAICAVTLAGCGSHHKAAPRPATPTPTPAVRPAARPATGAPALHATVVGHLPAAVQLPAVTAVGATVLAAGGLDAADASVGDVVRVQGRRARIVGRLPTALHDAAAATVGGHAYLFGGGEAAAGLDEILRLRVGGTATAAGRLPQRASDVSAATIGDTAYVVGGYTGTTPLGSVLAYRPGRAVRDAGRLPRPLRYAAVAAAGGAVYIAGGTSGTKARREVLRFDPGSGTVRRVALLPVPLTHAAGAALDGRFYVVGGRGDDLASQHAAIYVLRGTRMIRAGRLPRPLSDLGAATVGRRIVAVGGRDRAGGVHAEVLALRVGSARHQAATAAPMPRMGRIPATIDRHDVYAAGRPNALSSVAGRALPRVYVPDSGSDRVDVISQRTFRVVRRFRVGAEPQHVTPSWDLRTLWVTNDRGNSLTPIDPRTARPGRPVRVADPYNLYFTPDGTRAIVVAEAQKALDFREPHTMRLRHRLAIPSCAGIDHMDYTADGRLALVSCEFAARMVVVDLRRERVVKQLALRAGAMPQDVKLSPDGRTFYVADMASGGVWLIGARRMRRQRFQPTGAGAHGLYPSRDSRRLFVSNRGEGSISVISFRRRRPVAKWHLRGGGSPDMGGVSADGRVLWLSGRYDAEVYAISTRTGRLLHRIPVGTGPHGMAVWPQPGRYSIGHTGILR